MTTSKSDPLPPGGPLGLTVAGGCAILHVDAPGPPLPLVRARGKVFVAYVRSTQRSSPVVAFLNWTPPDGHICAGSCLRRPCYHAHWLHGQQDGVYAGCETYVPVHVIQIDHGIPKSKGGSDHMSDLKMPSSGRNVGMGVGVHKQLRAELRLDALTQ